jgi:hypothetical protein
VDITPAPATRSPTPRPSPKPTIATAAPIIAPTEFPTKQPTKKPTPAPTRRATESPTPAPSPKATPAPNESPTECEAEIETDQECYNSGEDLVVYFENCDPQPDDWIGIYASNEDPNNLGEPIGWLWACGDLVCSESIDEGEAIFREARGFGRFQVFLIRRNSGGPYTAYGIGNEFRLASSC